MSRFRLCALEFQISRQLRRMRKCYWSPVGKWAKQCRRDIARDPRYASVKRQFGEDLLAHVNKWIDDKSDIGSEYLVQRQHVAWQIACRVEPKWRTLFFAVGNVVHKTKCALEGHLKSGRELHSLDDIIEWISVAAASGVVGNIAYDVLRQSLRSGGVRRIVRRRRHPGREVGQDDALNYLVKLAIREQCRRHGFPIPLFSDLVIRDWNPGAETAIAIVASDHHQIRAVVEIPYRDIEDYGLRVIIHRPRW